jgi:hypothetical protein
MSISGGLPVLLIVCITVTVFIPCQSFANMPGEPGYVPPEGNINEPINQVNACDSPAMGALEHQLMGRNDENAKCAQMSFNDGSEISTSLRISEPTAKIETIVPKNSLDGIKDQVGFFAGYKVGFEAALNGKPEPPATSGDNYGGLVKGYEAGYFAGLAFQKTLTK